MKNAPKSAKTKKACKPANVVVKPMPGCKGKSVKGTKKILILTPPSKKKETREDKRQEARVNALLQESKAVTSKLENMRKTVETGKINAMSDMDRYIFMAMFTSLQAYMSALSFKLSWENVRLQTSAGVALPSRSPYKAASFFMIPSGKNAKSK